MWTDEDDERAADNCAAQMMTAARRQAGKKPRSTYFYALSDYMGFYRTCGTLQDYEVAHAISWSERLAQARQETTD